MTAKKTKQSTKTLRPPRRRKPVETPGVDSYRGSGPLVELSKLPSGPIDTLNVYGETTQTHHHRVIDVPTAVWAATGIYIFVKALDVLLHVVIVAEGSIGGVG